MLGIVIKLLDQKSYSHMFYTYVHIVYLFWHILINYAEI
jgi:hypothetical protein